MRNPLTSPRVRMLLVGALSVGLAYATFVLLITLGVHYLIASVANFFTYLIINFVLNKMWAFQSRGGVKKQAVAHFGLHVGNQAMIMAGLYILVEWAAIPAVWSQIILQVIAFLVVFTITPIIFKTK